jgi:ABC-type sugar transport system ATPase subunit
MTAAAPDLPQQASPVLTCRGVVKHYGGVVALRGVDLDVSPGVVHGLVGPNGAGKSTLMKIIAGAVAPTSGTVEVAGEPLVVSTPRDAARRGVILIPQELTTVPDMTVAENITLGSEPTRGGIRLVSSARTRAARALEAIGLDVSLNAYTGDLSPTHQRLVMLARGFDHSARLVILDEPTAGLPPHEAQLVLDAVQRLKERGSAVIYVSHHLSEVARICESVTCVREGRIAGSLSGAEITKERLVDLIHDANAASRKSTAATSHNSGTRSSISLRHVCGQRLVDVSVDIASKSVTGVTGLLGSGAKELVHVIAGVSRPTSGEVIVDGKAVTMRNPADALGRGVTFLAGDRTQSAIHGRSIRDNVSVSALRQLTRWGLVSAKAERRVTSERLGELNVTADPARLIGELSGGNQQRALVARCLAARSEVIVLDEPTIGVDVGAREDLWNAVRAMAATRAVVIASSEPEELVALCSRVICVVHGRVVAVIEGNELTEHAITHAIS